MKQLPKHILVVLILLVVIGLLGGGAWYWTSSQLTEKLAEKGALEGQIKAVEVKGIFPNTQNKKSLEEQSKKLNELLEGLQPQLQQRMDLFKEVRSIDPDAGTMRGLPPDGWKKLFEEKRLQLRKMAAEKNISLPDDYNFGFSSYVLAAPRAEHTLDLGIQLLTVEEMVKVLAQAGVDNIQSIKRAMVEDTRTGSGGGAGAVSAEGLNAKVAMGTQNTYRAMPFELAFKTDPETLVAVLNKLGASPHLFITRFVYIENEKSSVPKRSEITAAASTPETAQKTLIAVAGQEKVNVRIRLDLIDFLPPTKEVKGAKAK
ncbi:MAG: hypothetical protein HC904_07910 [Blastochloris sp.]|nr:hypothetical protein [Blastochloris sp.]